MKKWISVVVVAVFLVFATAAVADNGVSVGNKSFSLLTSTAVATGATVTSSNAVFDNPMNGVACDLVLSNATATGLFYLEGSVGSQVSGAYAFQVGNLVSAGTVTAGTINTYFVTGKPVRVIRSRYALVSGSSVTTNATINCHGVQ